MRGRVLRLVLALAALVAAFVALPAGAQDDQRNVLRIGWAQDPQTLNPFIGQDEENGLVWALTWDQLVNFSPDDLGPVPGIAETWDVSPDRRTVTYKLVEGAKWSDGEPVTSRDVKFSLEELGGDSFIFAGYTTNVTSIETPDDQTVVIQTDQPDARMIGGLRVFIIPEHVYGDVPGEELRKDFQPPLPMVGSGPYVVTEFERGRILTLERNRNFRSDRPAYDEIQIIKYGTPDAVTRALRLGEIDMDLETPEATFAELGDEDSIDTVRSSTPSFTQLAFNLCSRQDCPDAQVNPAVRDRTVRQAIAYAVDRERINEIAARGTSFPGNGLVPSFYEAWYEKPERDYPYDPDRANQMLDDAGWTREGDGPRRKGDLELSFDLFVRSDTPSDVQAARIVAEQAGEIGVSFSVQPVSTDRLTEIITRTVDDAPAPEFDTFIWGWGGDPYDPSGLLKLLTTEEIGATSDSFYSNPEYDRLFEQQTGEFDEASRRELIRRMVDIAQRDLPYLVLTEDPNLQAYRTDRVANVQQVCPRGDRGDILCETISYAPLLTLAPDEEGGDDGGGSTGIVVAIVVVVAGVLAFLFFRWRRGRGGREPLELEK
jgi:peptide/nickel transport system substrate-binding protein